MRKYLFAISSLIISLSLCSCRTSQYVNPGDYKEAKISFGSGGGVSGLITQYTLLDNGQLLKKMATKDSFELIQIVQKNKVSQVFKNYEFLKINDIQFKEPGNRYDFIKYRNQNDAHEIVWPTHQYPNNKNLEIFHSILKSMI